LIPCCARVTRCEGGGRLAYVYLRVTGKEVLQCCCYAVLLVSGLLEFVEFIGFIGLFELLLNTTVVV
jgi:hypothetical protein